VIELNDDNFEHDTQAATGATTGDWLIEFYAPWCGFCSQLAPVWEEVASSLKGSVNVAKVNVDEAKATTQRFAIRSLPTIKFFRGGHVYTFSKSDRSLYSLIEFAQGGYEKENAEVVPPPPTLWMELVNLSNELSRLSVQYFSSLHKETSSLNNDFTNIWKFRKLAAVIIFSSGFVLAFLLTTFCCCCCCFPSQRKRTVSSKSEKAKKE